MLDENIIAQLVNKLGYTSDEIKRFIHEENSFVSSLYKKIIDEQTARIIS
jgi:hypothetical protein